MECVGEAYLVDVVADEADEEEAKHEEAGISVLVGIREPGGQRNVRQRVNLILELLSGDVRVWEEVFLELVDEFSCRVLGDPVNHSQPRAEQLTHQDHEQRQSLDPVAVSTW